MFHYYIIKKNTSLNGGGGILSSKTGSGWLVSIDTLAGWIQNPCADKVANINSLFFLNIITIYCSNFLLSHGLQTDLLLYLILLHGSPYKIIKNTAVWSQSKYPGHLQCLHCVFGSLHNGQSFASGTIKY